MLWLPRPPPGEGHDCLPSQEPRPSINRCPIVMPNHDRPSSVGPAGPGLSADPTGYGRVLDSAGRGEPKTTGESWSHRFERAPSGNGGGRLTARRIRLSDHSLSPSRKTLASTHPPQTAGAVMTLRSRDACAPERSRCAENRRGPCLPARNGVTSGLMVGASEDAGDDGRGAHKHGQALARPPTGGDSLVAAKTIVSSRRAARVMR